MNNINRVKIRFFDNKLVVVENEPLFYSKALAYLIDMKHNLYQILL